MRSATVVLTAAVLCAPAAALAGPDEPAAKSKTKTKTPRRLRSEISIDVKNQDLGELMDRISRETGKTILVDPTVKARVTIKLRSVSWRVAMQVIARRTKCTIRALSGQVYLLSRPPRISVQFREANLRTALVLLAKYADKSIVLGPEVKGKVTLTLRDVSVLRAMRAMAVTHGFLVLGGSARSKLVTVGKRGGGAPTKPLEADLERKTFTGRFVSLEKNRLTLKLKKGTRVTLRLSETAAARKAQRKTLQGLKTGDRLIVTYAREGKRLVATNVIAEAR